MYTIDHYCKNKLKFYFDLPATRFLFQLNNERSDMYIGLLHVYQIIPLEYIIKKKVNIPFSLLSPSIVVKNKEEGELTLEPELRAVSAGP